MKFPIGIIFLCASLSLAAAQAKAPAQTQAPANSSSSAAKPAAPARKAGAGRSECAIAVELCVTVPSGWQRVGDIFDNLGFVVAEPHPGADSASWPQLTVAAIDVAPPKEGSGVSSSRPSLDALVDIVLTPDGSFTSAETLQRTRLSLNGADAEIVRVQLHNAADQIEAIEAVALIDGEEGLVYSIALRCAPKDFARLEPVFQRAARSWRIRQSAAQPTAQPTHKPEAQPAAPARTDPEKR
jgi:hypothetical protein